MISRILGFLGGILGVVVSLYWKHIAIMFNNNPESLSLLMLDTGGNLILLFFSLACVYNVINKSELNREITLATGCIGLLFAQFLWIIPAIFLITASTLYQINKNKEGNLTKEK